MRIAGHRPWCAFKVLVHFHIGVHIPGERITNAEAERRGKRRVLRISGLDERWSIDGSRGGNGTHYINHSCRPTAFMQTFGRKLLVLALRDIAPGEEITVDYVSTMHSDRKRCTCNAPGCRGTINKRAG